MSYTTPAIREQRRNRIEDYNMLWYCKADPRFQYWVRIPKCYMDVGRILRTFKIKKNVEVTGNGKIII